MSNATNMPLGAKDDIISASAANTPEILGVGADGLVLVADSTQASGLNWGSSAGSGELVQQVYASTAAITNCNTAIPDDNTIPQITEGTEVLTATITPNNSSNYLHITFFGWTSTNSASRTGCALFQDATDNALCAESSKSGTDAPRAHTLIYRMTAGTTSSTTFIIRIGNDAGSTEYLNATSAGARMFGGVSIATLTINEIAV